MGKSYKFYISRIISLIFITVFMFNMVSCASNDANKEESGRETIDLTLQVTEEDNQLISEIIQSFKKEYEEEADFNITVKNEKESESKGKILGDINNSPDVFSLVDDQVSALVAGGVLKPIEDSDDVEDQNIEGSIESAKINDKLYAYPMTADNGYFLYYNKQYLSDNDVSSLDNIISIAAQNNQKVSMNITSGWYFYSFFGNTGLKLGLNKDGLTNYCDWNQSSGDISGIDVANSLISLVHTGAFIDQDDDASVDGIKSGNTIAKVSGVWFESTIKEAWGDNYGAVKLPTYTCAGKQVQMASFSGYKLMGVNSYSQNYKWADKLARWITNEENQTLRFKRRGQGPSNKNAADSSEVKSSKAIQAILNQSEFSSLQRVGGSYWNPAENFAKNIVSGSIQSGNAQTSLDAMVEGIKESTIPNK